MLIVTPLRYTGGVGVRQRLYPTEEQIPVLQKHCDDERFLYNLSVEQYAFASKYRPYRLGKRQSWPSRSERGKQLTELRNELDWLKDGSRTIQNCALHLINQSYGNWFENPHHFRRPTFRSKYDKQGFGLADVNASYDIRKENRKWASVRIPKLKSHIKFRLTKPWTDIADTRSCRITLDKAGRWWISFPGKQPVVERFSTGAVVGVDRGIANTLATSDGLLSHIPDFTSKEKERFLRLERKLARQKKGSNRHQATKLKLNVLRQTKSQRKTDWIEKTSTSLVKDYDIIVFEKLFTRNMSKSARGTVEKPGKNVAQKKGLNRSIQSQRWGELLRRTKQKSETCFVQVIEVPAHNTSITCNVCNHRNKGSRESQASFLCVNCGHIQHADVNASINILNRGLESLDVNAPGCGVSGRGDLQTVVGSMKRQPNQTLI